MTDFATRRRMMVDTQIRPSDVTKFPIIEAMLTVPRELYVPASQKEAAYMGEQVSLANGRAILDPRVLAKMLDAVDVQPDEIVLDLGCGLGYSTAILARLGEAVVAVEEDAQLAADAQTNLSENGVDNAAVVEGPLAAGDAKHGPYDVVFLQGAAEHMPQAILDQVKEGGRIIAIFQEAALGVCRVGYKIDGEVSWRYAFNGGAPVLPGFERERAFVL